MSSKQIHIEKYDFATFEIEQQPYIMLPRHIIQNLPADKAYEFAMWLFLQSHPVTWEPNKSHLMKHFDISARTYERRMEWLNTVHLIEYRQDRLSSGTFGKTHLVILNGTKFNPDAASNGTVKIDGAVVDRKKDKVIHRKEDHRSAKFDGAVKSPTNQLSCDLSTPPPFRQKTVQRLDDAHIYKTIKINKEKKKTDNPLVTVFFDNCSVRSFIEKVIGNRNMVLEDDTMDQGIYYSFETNPDKSFDAVNKRINIFLKKVREGQWLIPQGFNGITSQSIRAEDEEYERKKQIGYEEDSNAMQSLTVQAESKLGPEFMKFSAMIKNMRSSLNANN